MLKDWYEKIYNVYQRYLELRKYYHVIFLNSVYNLEFNKSNHVNSGTMLTF